MNVENDDHRQISSGLLELELKKDGRGPLFGNEGGRGVF